MTSQAWCLEGETVAAFLLSAEANLASVGRAYPCASPNELKQDAYYAHQSGYITQHDRDTLFAFANTLPPGKPFRLVRLT